jgi:hypothetical protein
VNNLARNFISIIAIIGRMNLVKRFVLFGLAIMLCFISPASILAEEVSRDAAKQIKQIDRGKIAKLKDKHKIKGVFGESEREDFLRLLDELSNTQQQANALKQINKYTTNQEQQHKNKLIISEKEASEAKILNRINMLPVIKLTFEELVELGFISEQTDDVNNNKKARLNEVTVASASTPYVPNDTLFVDFYGITSYTKINNVQYEVFEIVAQSKKVDGIKQAPLYNSGFIQLLSTKSYTRDHFDKAVSGLATQANNFFYPPWFPLSFITDPSAFFASQTTQKLELEYEAMQTFVYTYVSDGNAPFDFMQTAERVAWYEIRKAVSYQVGTPTITNLQYANKQAVSTNYLQITAAATRYANYQRLPLYYKVGDVEFYHNGIYRGEIPIVYHHTLDSILY